MSKTDCTADIFTAASLHLDVVDEFIAITQKTLAGANAGFTRDSLADLLDGLTEQREAYRAALAAAAPAITALAA